MEQIIIKHIDGTQTIFPNREYVAMVTKAEQKIKLLDENTLTIEITSAFVIDFKIGDYIDIFGQTYVLNQLPTLKKANSHSFSYSLTFESEQYELMDCVWLLPDETVGESFTGNLEDFLKILINTNMAGRSTADWKLGTYPSDTETKTLSFSDTNCLAVLQNICDEWEVEFEIVRNGDQRILNIAEKIGDQFAFPFTYGRTGGLYSIERKNNSNQNVVTRLYAFGSSDNVPSSYRHSRICLPDKIKNKSYIENTADQSKFGYRENVHNFDDIKPERVGTVQKIDGSILKFKDDSMFDLNEKDDAGNTKWLIAGTSAKITFQTGNLAGYSFDVNNYVHSTHTFTINSFADENGQVFPSSNSAAFQFDDGDEYIIEDIVLPDSYISDAENRLQTAAQEYYDEYCKPHVDYSIQVDALYLERLLDDDNVNAGVTNIFNVGDAVKIIDDDLSVNDWIRISQISRDALHPYSYTLTLSNEVQISNLQRVIGNLSKVNKVIQMNDLNDAARAKRNWKTSQEVLNSVFDTDGDYFTEKIRPLSIETSMLSVGARGQQFVINGALIQANYGGDANTVHVNSGTLEHYTINSDGTIREWTLSDTDVSDLDADTPYYIYAKCSKDDDGGQIVFDTTQHQTDEDGDYYYFLCGVLSSVMTESETDAGSRQVSLTYGNTTINGRYITTGVIKSADGSCQFDLDNNKFIGPIQFTDGLLSSTIKIGPSEDDVWATLGYSSGSENILYAGNNSNYYLYITKKGALFIQGGPKNTLRLVDIRPESETTSDTSKIYFHKINVGTTLTVGSNATINGAAAFASSAAFGDQETTTVKNAAGYLGIIPSILWSGQITYDSTTSTYTAKANIAAKKSDGTAYSFSLTRSSTGYVKLNVGTDRTTANTICMPIGGSAQTHVSLITFYNGYINVTRYKSDTAQDGDFWLTLFSIK